MANKTKSEQDDRYEFNSVKIAHELMVDILGALIPGALFLFCIIGCIVFPMICYSTQKNNFGFLMKDGDWFWIVAFLSFLILSYVLGLIFYRADIKLPDRADIRREQSKKLISYIDGLIELTGKRKRIQYSANLLLGEVEPLANALNDNDNKGVLNPPYDKEFEKKCNEVVRYLKRVIEKPIRFYVRSVDHKKFLDNILMVLFPESIKNFENKTCSQFSVNPNTKYSKIADSLFPSLDRLPYNCRQVIINSVRIVPLVEAQTRNCQWKWNRHLRYRIRLFLINHNCWITGFKFRHEAIYNSLMIAYLCLHMQNESGCATEKRCDFPYMSYYKYLLKRRQYELLKYANWTSSNARTKNRINKYKIDLQLHVPNAYAIIIKNESHVRMASSSWHVSRIIRMLSIVTLIVTLCLGVLGIVYHGNTTPTKDDKEFAVEDGSKITVHYNEGDVSTVKANWGKLAPVVNVGNRDNECFMKFVETRVPFISNAKLSNIYLAILFPFLILLLAIYIYHKVPRFIHYQRLREIFYTLRIYKLWKDASKKKRISELQDINIRRAEVGLPPIKV